MSKWSKLKTLNKVKAKEGEEDEEEEEVSDKSNIIFIISFPLGSL